MGGERKDKREEREEGDRNRETKRGWLDRESRGGRQRRERRGGKEERSIEERGRRWGRVTGKRERGDQNQTFFHTMRKTLDGTVPPMEMLHQESTIKHFFEISNFCCQHRARYQLKYKSQLKAEERWHPGAALLTQRTAAQILKQTPTVPDQFPFEAHSVLPHHLPTLHHGTLKDRRPPHCRGTHGL